MLDVFQIKISVKSSVLCHDVYELNGACCIVFDIDGMLFEFFMNILNIEKNKITWKKFPGGGGGGVSTKKQFFNKAIISYFISRLMLFQH